MCNRQFIIQIFYSKVSYLIVDQAEKDMEVSKDGIPNDPFLDAEIDISSPLSPIVGKPLFKRPRNQDSLSDTLEETAIPQGTPRAVLKNMKPLNTGGDPQKIQKTGMDVTREWVFLA